MKSFYEFILAVEAGETPPTPDAPPPGGGTPPPGGPPGSPPPPGGDPLAGLGGGGMGGPPPPGGDPMGGGMGGPSQTRKAINITTWEDALKSVLGKDAHREPKKDQVLHKQGKKEIKPKSLTT